MVRLQEIEDKYSPDRRTYLGVGPENIHFAILCWVHTGNVELHTLSPCCSAILVVDWEDDVACQRCDGKLLTLSAETHQPVLIRSLPRGGVDPTVSSLPLAQAHVKTVLRNFFEGVEADPLASEVEADHWTQAIAVQVDEVYRD